MTSKPFIMWVLDALGGTWTQVKNALTPWRKQRASHHWGAKSRHCAGAAERTFLLESNRFELQWIVDFKFPLAHLKTLSLIPLLQVICCPSAAEEQSRKGQLFSR